MSWEKKMPIISSVLLAKLYRLGISQTQASLEMGFSYSYLSVCFKRGWMPEHATKIVEERYGIPYEVYAKKPAEEEVDKDPTIDLVLEELRTIRSLLQDMCNRV